MSSCKYTGAFTNPSGYGTAARNFIASLYTAGIDITTESISQMPDTAQYEWIGELCNALKDRKIDYKIKIIHLTPDLIPRYMETGKFHISHLFWETDRLPKEWISPLNHINEIWTQSEQQAEMIRNSGVKTPIKCFPQPINTLHGDAPTEPFIIPNFEGFAFYAIFEWILRKNPEALLKTYWKTFQGKDDVVLILKTYRSGYTDRHFDVIRSDIKKWKIDLGLKSYPKIALVTNLFSTQDMFRLHKTGQVFVSPSRGEGNCIPAVEASLMGNPVISIDKTGFADIFPKDIFYPISCTPSPVVQVPTIPWYESPQNWLDINTDQLSEAMLNVYNNRKEAKERGQKASAWVKENLNFHKAGQDMKARLEEISKFL